MGSGIGLLQRVENLRVGKKLGLGFGLVLLLVIAIAATVLLKFNDINQRADKVDFSIKMSNMINEARINRTLYQINYDPQYLQKNQDQINLLLQMVTERGAQLQWDADSQTDINMLPERIKQYIAAQADLQRAVTAKNAIRDSWNLSESETIAKTLQQQLRVEDADPAIRLSLSEMIQKLISIRFDANTLLLSMDKKSEAAVLKSIDETLDNTKKLNALLLPDEQSTLAPLVTTLSGFKSRIVAYIPAYEQEAAYSKTLSVKAADMNALVVKIAQKELTSTHNDIRDAEVLTGVIALAALVAGIIISLGITRQITLPLNNTLQMAKRIAEGDLTAGHATVRSDELGMLMNAVSGMNDNLRNMIGDIRQGVREVSNAASEISSGNTDLSSRTEEQAAAVEQTAASMEQLSSTVKQNTDNAHQASKLATEASQTAQTGGKQVSDVVLTMQQISGSSKRIAEITSVINGIAFQTNILALNAAVEAARAGEQGRGFSVVASEVRSLAQRSAQAAKEIEGLIAESVERVNSGAKLVEKTGHTMQDIVKSVSDVRDIMSEIASASDEQSRGINQISLAIVEMDTTTQQNSALVEQSASAADTLEEQARALSRAVSVFRLTDGETSNKTGTLVPSSAKVTTFTPRQNDKDNWETF
ncbi:MAG: methyl-accepting chemotaxis protein [Rouxiella aceris]|uniref:methyl-accepting chemotaxis protein n=1 Tax=Rouxiella aceris TaxID=2703884 RepID=UPI0028435BFB|nr:methyl-accepting chemotaxis protein [Rouxiella aceris]MDR3433347.1 methyl-accepting chemotaxis protein [Rouxiella aceris]